MKKWKYIVISISAVLVLACGAFSLSVLLQEETAPAVQTEASSTEASSAEATAEAPSIPLLSTEESEASLPTPETKEPPKATPAPEPVFEEYDITLMAVGDNLLHMGIVNTGKQPDGTYEYSFLFDGIRDFLDATDIKIINQETILGGNELGFSGYPLFNSPTEIGDAIAGAGFNVVLHSSNHSGDKGAAGLISCANFWKKYPEVLMVGIHEDQDGPRPIPLITIGDFSFAVLNYSYSANRELLPKELMGHMDMLCNYDEATGQMDFTTLHPKVLEDISTASALADVVIVCPHWGNEYNTVPSRYQQLFAQQMTQAGADLIIGTHPHVIQPVEWITSENGNQALCYYSLGNFVSTQKQTLCMLEAMAWVTFHVTEEGISLDENNTGVIPMVCHYTSNPVRFENVYLLEEYTAEQAASHGILDYGGVVLNLEELQTWSNDVLGEWVLTKSEALNGVAASEEEPSTAATAAQESAAGS